MASEMPAGQGPSVMEVHRKQSQLAILQQVRALTVAIFTQDFPFEPDAAQALQKEFLRLAAFLEGQAPKGAAS